MKIPSASSWLTLIGLSAGRAAAELLIGYGNMPYDPLCAESCLRSLTTYTLDCTHTADGDHSHSHGPATSPECFASSTPFLTTVAWCMNTKCAEYNIPVSKLQLFGSSGSPGAKA